MEYPPTRAQNFSEIIHGSAVDDPYRWLEDIESEDVSSWISSQNEFSRRLLDKMDGRLEIQQRLGELSEVGHTIRPITRGGRAFYQKLERGRNQAVLRVRKIRTSEDSLLIDPTEVYGEMSALDWWFPSPNGEFVAYGVSEGGSEWSTLYVKNVTTGKDLQEKIPHTRGCQLAWFPKSDGFYYTRFPGPTDGTLLKGEDYINVHLYKHELGTPWELDPKVFGDGRDPTEINRPYVSADGQWLVNVVDDGFQTSEIHIGKSGGQLHPVVTGVDALFRIRLHQEYIYILTNLDASKCRVARTRLDAPDLTNWESIIEEQEDPLLGFEIVGDQLVVRFLRNACSQLAAYSLSGKFLWTLDLPGTGTATCPVAENGKDTGHFTYSSFTEPAQSYEYNSQSMAVKPWDTVDTGFDPSDFIVDQIWYRSKDGTDIPMFLVHKHALQRSGANPVILTGYGGYGLLMSQPFFNWRLIAWLEMGGIFATPSIRGGGEFGTQWHEAGRKHNKQNIVDDFIAAAEWLIDERYTNADKLAIRGESHGGMLVGAAITQRPELFRAAHCTVGVLDLLRFHLTGGGQRWLQEFGSPNDPREFEYLHRLSPYHNIIEGPRYPAVLLTTAINDTRVSPHHSMKMAAKLQRLKNQDRPILLSVESRAGHGDAGKSTDKMVDTETDVLTFFCDQLGIGTAA